jgi:hypothetical protein
MKWKKMFLVGVYKGEMTYSKSEGLHAKWLPKMPGHREFPRKRWRSTEPVETA